MDRILMNELLDKLENRTCVRFHSNTEMREFVALVKELTPRRYFPRADTWRFGAGTSYVDGDAISCNPMNHMISHTASVTCKRVIDYAELSGMYRHAVPDLGGLI